MAWDATRPVPWTRLMREWVVYALIMCVIFAFFFRDSGLIGPIAGVLVSGPLYLALGYVLAKLGYQRKSLADLRTPRAERDGGGSGSRSGDRSGDGSGDGAGARPKPPPTRRTSTGPSNRPSSSRKRKR